MKFQTGVAFEKHLKDSFPHHLSRIYLLVSPCEYEKGLWAEQVIATYRQKEPNLQVTRFNATETPSMVIQDEVRAPSLWGGLRVIIVEALDKVKPLGPFLDLLNHIPNDVVLIFKGSSQKPLAELYQKGKKELIAIDTSDEKPWDKEKRMQEWIKDEARKQGKQLPPDVALEMVHLLGTDLATLDQEFKKLLTYVGSKVQIDKNDMLAICGSRDLSTGWQLADLLVWKQPIDLRDKGSDLGFIFPFIGQVRYQLQLGAQIADLIERKVPYGELKSRFPTVRNLDKLIPVATKRTSSFFLSGILRLYDFELSAKSAALDLSMMFDLFQMKLYEKTHSSS